MVEPLAPPPAPPQLYDPWEERGPIPLDGVLERNQFAPLLTALLGLVLAFVLFQVVVAPIATFTLLTLKGIGLNEIMSDLPGLLAQEAQTIITANTIGQVFGIGLVGIVLARWHSSRLWAFLRVRKTDLPFLVLSVFGLFALMPVVQWLGVVNEWIPLPESIRAFDQSQMELVAQVMDSDFGIVFSLAMLAVTPAICEELLFRGYVQRQGERGLGTAGGILLSGVLFGLYHLRLTQALPLSALGLYLAYLAWRTGSLWIPVVVHFANNAFAVMLGAYVSSQPDMDLRDIEQFDVPWYAVALGALFFAATIYAMHRHAETELAKKAESKPVPHDPLVSPSVGR